MSSQEEIIKSFEPKEKLNPKIWYTPKGEDTPKMQPEVREALLKVAQEFIEYIKVEFFFSDIIMPGSLANYNWSKFSDADVHIIVDLEQFDKDEIPLYQEIFKIKKTLFNNTHDIKVRGYDVEVYIEDSSVPRFSQGTYSIMFDEWVSEPEKEKFSIDRNILKKKIRSWENQIDLLISQTENEDDINEAKKLIKKLDDKLKKYRTEGLRKGGEMSYENLVFKALRRNGYIGKMKDFENNYIDKYLSVEQRQE
jgi:predicted nucleotidyltransferase